MSKKNSNHLQVKKFKGRAHWGKNGLIYHSSEMLDFRVDPEARQKFVGKFFE